MMNQFTDTIEDENYPQGLVLVPRGGDDGVVAVGPHIRGRRLRAYGNEEVDLLLPGTARYQFLSLPSQTLQNAVTWNAA